MTVKNVQYAVNLPRVTVDNCLEFDPNGPVPDKIPHFTKIEEMPWKFKPCFEQCKYRTTQTRKLNNCETCTRTREVWYCTLLKEDIFPITCASCTKREV